MLINTFHGKQNHTFTKIYKFYNRITTGILINNGRFRVVLRSQCNDGQKHESCKRLVKTASDMLKGWLQEKLTFICITHIMPFKISKNNF